MSLPGASGLGNLASGNTSRTGEQIALASAAARFNVSPCLLQNISFFKIIWPEKKSGSIFFSLQNKPSLVEG